MTTTRAGGRVVGHGPLAGVRVVELAGIGPGPYAATILADLGADVVRVERPGPQLLGGGPGDLTTRSRDRIEVDLKSPQGVESVLTLVESADILLEGNRPGVVERLGLGPAECLARNPRLVFGRMTGWGQDGPLAHSAGHDLTYVATCGVLHGLGQDEGKPQFPMNLLGDFGGGSTFLVIGVLAALVHARVSGAGQVVDAAIVDGTAYLDLLTAGFRAAGEHSDPRGSNLLDGGAPFYQLYRTADDRWMAVGAIEPQFFRELVHRLGLEGSVPGQYETERYAEMRALFETAFAQKTMAEWSELFEGTDSCVAPVLTPAESSGHRHMAARGTYVTVGGIVQPAAAPRFSGTSLPTPRLLGNAMIGDVLKRWGIAD